MNPQDSGSRGGARKGSGRRHIGIKRHLTIPDELWSWCLAQAGGAAGYIRALIAADREKKSKEK